MLDIYAGYKTQIRVLERQLKELDHTKLDPTKVKELTDTIKNLKDLVKEKEDKREERRKKKQEAEASKPSKEFVVGTPKAEASSENSGDIRKPELKYNSSTEVSVETKEASVEKFAIDSKVEPVRGTPGSWGLVMREAGINGDPLCYVKWMEGSLAQRDGYGGYYPSDLRIKAEEKKQADYEQKWDEVYNLKADLKSNYEQSIKNLEEEKQMALDKGEATWAHRLEQKIDDLRKAYEERFPAKTAEEKENGSGGSERLKVVDFTPSHDKDPQEKELGVGGDRAYGWQTAPKSDKSSLPLESSLKKADLNTLKINVGSNFYNVTPLARTGEQFSYDIADSLGTKLFKVDAKQELNQEHLAQIIRAEVGSKKEAKECNCKTEKCQGCSCHCHRKMAKLTADLAFLKKGTLVSILSKDENKKQVKFASLDGSLKGWAPSKKFAAFGDIEQKMIQHGDHQDELFAEAGNEILVACPAGSTNISFRAVEQPPATPESLNPDVTAAGPEKSHADEEVEIGYANPDVLDSPEDFEGDIEASLKINSHIRHEDGKWVIYSHDYKKKLGTYDSEKAAKERLKQIETFKHMKSSLQPLSKKEADQDPVIDLHTQIDSFKQRMTEVQNRLSQPPTKTADVETKEDLSKVDVKDLAEGIAHMIDLLETKTHESEDVHPLLEELENKLWEAEIKLGLKPELKEHELSEPEHASVVKEVEKMEEPTEKESAVHCPYCQARLSNRKPGAKCEECGKDVPEDIVVKESAVEVKADDINTPPTQTPPPGMKWAWEPRSLMWILVATGTSGF
jgi:hypothetical protein